jgi:signal transduction histidine kinase
MGPFGPLRFRRIQRDFVAGITGRARIFTADSLPPRTTDVLQVEPEIAGEVGLISDLLARAQRGAPSALRFEPVDLYAVERTFGRHFGDKRARSGVATARERALELAEAAGGASPRLALSFASEIFVSLAVERPWRESDVQALLRSLARIFHTTPQALGVEVLVEALRAPQLLELPPSVALEVQLSMLLALTSIAEASIWTKDSGGRPQCLITFGRTATTRRFRSIAVETIDGVGAESGERGSIVGAPIRRWQQPFAALVARARTREGVDILLTEAAAAMGPILEREFLLDRSAAREQSLVRASERRLGRLGFDLHDGALQHIAAFAADLHLVRGDLRAALPERKQGPLDGRIDDLERRVWELDRVLRELAHSLEPASLVRRPLARVIESEVAAFRERTGIEINSTVTGEFGAMTPSQKIALVRIVQEALTNIREHGNASTVVLMISATRGRFEARIEDDGDGFDVARTLLDAAKRGRLGLVGSSERVRLLGGTFDVRSRPGGPTIVSASLPRWQPLLAADESVAAVGPLAP